MSSYRITINANGQLSTLDGDSDSRLLETLNEGGLLTRNPCRNGVCGLCKCKLSAGEITYHWRLPHGLWEKDKAAAYILPCIAYPTTDISLTDLPLEKN